MYYAFLNGQRIFDPSMDLMLDDTDLTLADNSAGHFNFTIYENNPGYELVKEILTGVVSVYWDDELLYKGRIINVEQDFYKGLHVETEGELAYLDDTIQRPAEYHEMTVRGYLAQLIDNHNAKAGPGKQFTVGSVTVTDSNDSLYRYTNWESTLDQLKDDLVESLGGHFRVRYDEDGTRILDYLADYPRLANQTIEFGENLLSYTENTDATVIATVCIPLGAKQDTSSIDALEERLTIASVNGGSDEVKIDAAIERYGRITKVVTWDNVQTASVLMAKGQQWLADNQYADVQLTLSAVDLADFGVDVDHLRLLDRIRCTSAPHGMDREFPVTEMKLDLIDPTNNTYTLGTKNKGFASGSSRAQKSISQQISNYPSKSHVLQLALDNAASLINMYGSDGHVMITNNEIYIMDYDNIEDAQNVWRWNLGGLAYSNSGYEGPYTLAITMDGTISGQFIAAGTIGADQIDVSYTSEQEKKWTDTLNNEYWKKTEIQTAISNSADSVTLAVQSWAGNNYYTKSEIDVTVSGINSTVSQKVGASTIISTINQSAESVKISSSKFDVDASAIRLQSTTLEWSSTYSSLTSTGKLTCTSANISGTLKCGSTSSYWMQLSSGQLTAGYKSTTAYGTIDCSALYADDDGNIQYRGLWEKAQCMVFYTSLLGISRTYSASTSTRGYTGSINVAFNMNSTMTSCSNGNIQFINGICVSCPS